MLIDLKRAIQLAIDEASDLGPLTDEAMQTVVELEKALETADTLAEKLQSIVH